MSLLAQRNFAGGEIAPPLYNRTDTNKYQTGLRTCYNAQVLKHGGVSNRPGTKYLGVVGGTDNRLIPFVVNSENSYVLLFTHLSIDIYQGGVKVQTLVSPYQGVHLKRIQYVQSVDVMTLTHKEYPVQEIKRTGTPGSYTFSISPMSFIPATTPPGALTFAGGPAGSNTHAYVACHIDPNTKEESLPSAELSGTYANPNKDNPIRINIPAHAVYKDVVIYKKIHGRYGYFGMAATGAVYSDIGMDPSVSDSPAADITVLKNPNQYPGVVGYFQQRLCFASSNEKPETVWMSRTGKFKNFTSSSPIKSDDSISFTAAGRQINEVRHLVDAGALVMFTSGAEWVAQGSDSGALTPATINLKQSSYNGSSYLMPLSANGNVLYVQARGSIIRDLSYEMASDGYRGNDLTVFSSHFFEGRSIVDWCYQQIPNSVIWAVMSDGKMLGCTYIKEHQIFGWHQHAISRGQVESICSIPAETEDEFYVVVKRTINGAVVRYLEVMTSRNIQDLTSLNFTDSMKYYSNPTESNIPQVLTGLGHLEGEQVAIIADGSVIGNPLNDSYEVYTVTAGQIVLPRTFKKIFVGLPYYSDIETLDIDVQGSSIMDKKVIVNKATVFFQNTRGVFMGSEKPTGENLLEGLVEFKTRTGLEIPESNGPEDIIFNGSWKKSGRMLLRQVDPLPMTILAITPDGLLPIGGN